MGSVSLTHEGKDILHTGLLSENIPRPLPPWWMRGGLLREKDTSEESEAEK